MSLEMKRKMRIDVHLPGYTRAKTKLNREHASENRALFRRHLAHGIKSASPIVAALCTDGLDLSATLNIMETPQRTKPERVPWWLGFRAAHPGPPTPDEHPRAFSLRHEALGVIERWPDDPLGRLGIRLRSGCLDAEISIGEHVLWTSGPTAHLILNATLPATIAMAMPGRTVEQIVSHPLLAGAYEVIAVTQHEVGWTEISFSTGMVGCKASVVDGAVVAQLLASVEDQ